MVIISSFLKRVPGKAGCNPLASIGIMSLERAIDFELQDCVLPVSTRACSIGCHYSIIPIFNDGSHPKLLAEETSARTRTLLASWAILLHFYLVRDTVSFVYTYDVKAVAREPEKQHLLRDGNEKAKVLYFDVQDLDRLHDVKDVSSKILMPGESPVNRMNTAVQLRTTSLTDSINVDKQADPKQIKTPYEDAPGFVRQVCSTIAETASY